jgi:ATP synthase H subunit
MEEAKLKEIKITEDEAKKTVDVAKIEAQGIINNATEEGITLYNNKKQKTKEDSKKLIEDAKKSGIKEAETIMKGLESNIKDLEKTASANISKAEEIVIKKIMTI